jgi:myo-inositol-1(or 4)-monophosphatase
MSDTLNAYLDFALVTAWEAGRITLRYFQNGVRPEWKADESPVTIADRQAEELIRSRLEERFPDHTLLGEEFGQGGAAANASHRWLIDPIDGTRAFIRGVPLYGVLIGLEIEGQSQVGVAHYPALNETVWAAAGLGAWYNGAPARVSPVEQLSEALLTHTDLKAFERYGRQAEWERLQRAVRQSAGWSDAYGYLLTATGRAELMLDPIMNPWDCGPFPVIFAEAGGFFGDWNGNVTAFAGEALATSRALLPQVLDVLHHPPR